MKAKDSMLVYNPGTDQVAVFRYPIYNHEARDYKMSLLACDSTFRESRPAIRKTLLFIEAYQAIVRDGVDPGALHRALFVIDEYREGIEERMQCADPAWFREWWVAK